MIVLLPSRVFAEAAVPVGRLAFTSKIPLFLVDWILLTAAPFDDTDEHDDEQKK